MAAYVLLKKKHRIRPSSPQRRRRRILFFFPFPFPLSFSLIPCSRLDMLLPTLIRTGGRVSWSPLTRSSGRSLGTFSPLRINTSSSYSSSYSTYSSASPQRWSRFLVPGLVAGNVAVFLTYSYGVSRLTNQRDGTIVRWFDRNGVLSSANFREGRWWTLLTHGFTHHNIIHLASNMIVLYSLGRPLALAIGARNFLATYLSSMVVGGMASLASRRYWYDPKSLRHQSASIGASGKGKRKGMIRGMHRFSLILPLFPFP